MEDTRGGVAITDLPNVPLEDFSGIEVSIVMPCLDEAETIAFCIEEAMAALEDSGIKGEVVIADNGSTDGSQAIATDLGARVVDVSEPGYGNALRGGIESSYGEIVVMADSDGSYDFGHVPRIVEKMREGYDLVMGNRFRGGIEKGAMPWKHRYIGNPVLSGIGRLLFQSPVKDFHCGLRGIRKTAFLNLNLTTTGMEFASEMVIKATLAKLPMIEVPTVLRPDGRNRPPHLQSWRDGWRHLRFMLLFSPRWLFAVPGLCLMSIGIIAMTLIAIGGPARIGGVGFSVNTSIASSMMVILGFQLLSTGVFARTLASRIGLLPPSRLLVWAGKIMTLERGLVAGIVIALFGIALLGSAGLAWRAEEFGKLERTLTLRQVIPAMTTIIVGIQLLFQSFLLGLIGFAFSQQKETR